MLESIETRLIQVPRSSTNFVVVRSYSFRSRSEGVVTEGKPINGSKVLPVEFPSKGKRRIEEVGFKVRSEPLGKEDIRFDGGTSVKHLIKSPGTRLTLREER